MKVVCFSVNFLIPQGKAGSLETKLLFPNQRGCALNWKKLQPSQMLGGWEQATRLGVQSVVSSKWIPNPGWENGWTLRASIHFFSQKLVETDWILQIPLTGTTMIICCQLAEEESCWEGILSDWRTPSACLGQIWKQTMLHLSLCEFTLVWQYEGNQKKNKAIIGKKNE